MRQYGIGNKVAPEVDVLFGGHLFCDLVLSPDALPEPGTEVFSRDFLLTAGGVANRAVTSARLGMTTGILGSIGHDIFGNAIFDQLGSEPNVDLEWLTRHDRIHTAVTVSVTNEHDRSFITYYDPAMEHIGPLALGDSHPAVKVCHSGIAQGVPEWAQSFRRQGSTVVGGVGWDSTGQWSQDLFTYLDDVDVFCANSAEAMKYTDTDTPAAAATILSEHVQTCIVTMGRKGAVLISDGSWFEHPGIAVESRDPTGAGDAFISAYITAMNLDWPETSRLQLAILVSALSVQSLGGAAAAPHRRDIVDFLDRVRPAGDWAQIRAWALNDSKEKTTCSKSDLQYR